MHQSTKNKELGLAINRDIWNAKRFDLIPDYFTEDFIADYSPRVVRSGRDAVRAMVESSHSTFEDFKETVHLAIADEEYIVLHFTISGRQVGDWGPIKATGRFVSYDEIVIMQVRDEKVCHQRGVSDVLLALQQLKAIPDPAGFTDA
ncbi:MAG: ester cyclase [Pseudomonadales bacterium]